MTWFANHVYAKHEPALVAELRNHRTFGKGLYLVSDISDYPWYRPEHKHSLPPEGLVVVRELCAPNTSACEWHQSEDDELPWTDAGDSSDHVIISPEAAVSATHQEAHDELLPPTPFLQFLKALSIKSGVPLAYYAHFMWGGDTEYEYAWVFGEDERTLILLDNDNYLEMQLGKPPRKQSGGVLRSMLTDFGMELPTPFFALHSGRFDWSRYKIPGTIGK